MKKFYANFGLSATFAESNLCAPKGLKNPHTTVILDSSILP